MIKDDWSFAGVWNTGLLNVPKRPLVPRDYLWASDLGKAPVDVFLAMKGVAKSNPPNARSLRKFEAGNIFEWIVKLILKRAGILIDDQRRCEHQFAGLLKVTGKADFIAGGKPDFARAIAEMKALDMPPVFIEVAERLEVYFATNFPSGLIEKPLEIKSLGAYIFEALLKRKTASRNHRLQTFHYVISEARQGATIVYICRDDMRLQEIPVYNTEENLKEYKDQIALLSEYYLSDTQPPLEKPIVFDEDMGKFATNYNVAYSGYLTMLYGLKDQAEFDGKYKGMVGRWNRVMGRLRDGKKMTKLNLEAMVEIAEAGFDPSKLASKFVEIPDEEEAETPS